MYTSAKTTQVSTSVLPPSPRDWQSQTKRRHPTVAGDERRGRRGARKGRQRRLAELYIMQSVCSPVGFMVGRFDYRAPLLIGEPIPALGRLFCCALLLGREKTYKIIPSSATETERLIEMQIRAMHMDARGGLSSVSFASWKRVRP